MKSKRFNEIEKDLEPFVKAMYSNLEPFWQYVILCSLWFCSSNADSTSTTLKKANFRSRCYFLFASMYKQKSSKLIEQYCIDISTCIYYNATFFECTVFGLSKDQGLLLCHVEPLRLIDSSTSFIHCSTTFICTLISQLALAI